MRKFLLLLITIFSFSFIKAQVSEADAAFAKQLISKNSSAAGLSEQEQQNVIISSTYKTAGGLQMVYLLQTYQGIPVYNQIQVLAFKNEILVSNAGGRIRSIEKMIGSQPSFVSSIAAKDAVAAVLQKHHLQTTENIAVKKLEKDKFNFGRLAIAEQDVTAQLMWVPVSDSSIKLTWQVLVVSNKTPDAWQSNVDVRTGVVIHEINLTVFDDFGTPEARPFQLFSPENNFNKNYFEKKNNITATNTPFVVNNATYRVVKFPAESPSHPGGTQTDHTNPWTMAPGNATTLGWQYDGTNYHDSTRGNNVWAAEDRANTDAANGSVNNLFGKAAVSTTAQPDLTFPFTSDFTKEPTDAATNNQKAAITNLFYWCNIVHDLTYLYGFDEASGNFQVNNLGRGGVGNDEVKAQAQDGGGTNNANFLTLAEGTRGRMQMYLWTSVSPARDGDLDNGVIVHEYGHGISNRLTGGPAQTGCVSNAEGGGEGWSDYYALMYTTNWATATVNDGFNISRGIATYARGQATTGSGLRSFRYSTNIAVNPLVYKTVMPGESHAIGEYWCEALWEMTWEIIQQAGINPNIYNPNGAGGNSVALKLVTEGMKLQPCSPGFIDARNAILKADTLLFGAQYSCAIWRAFAKRGMGRNATQGSSSSVTDQVPSFLVDNGLLSLTGDLSQVQEGQNVTYTNTVTAGNCLGITNSSLTIVLPDNVTYVSGGSYNAASRTITFSPVNISTGNSQSFPFTVTVNNGTYFTPVTHINETVAVTGIPASWTASSAAWTTSANFSHSSPNSFFVANPAAISDMQLATTASYTLLPATSSNYTTLTFWHRFQTEEGWDGGVVEVSTDGGSNWSDLGSKMITGKYNSSLGIGSNNPIGGRSAFSGLTTSFMQTVIDLSSYAGQSIKIRFRFGSDDNTAPNGGGWYIDDIVLYTEPAVSLRSNLFNSSSVLLNSANVVTKILQTIACVPATITAQPANTNGCSGGNTSFSVTVTGSVPSYQWQVNTGSGFVNVPAAAPYSGTATSTLTITGITTAMNGYQYRVIVSGQCATAFNSAVATLSVGSTAAITAQPSNIAACAATPASFSVIVTNPGSYQWQVNTGSGFVDVPAAAPYSGAATSTLAISAVTAAMNNYQYRVVIGSCPSSITSNAATLTVAATVAITTQPPASLPVCIGTNANITIVATGTITSYQWQVSTNGGGTFNNIPGANAAILTLTNVSAAQNNNIYHVIITSSCNTITSANTILTVNPSPVFTLNVLPAQICITNPAIDLTASVAGGIWSGAGVQNNQFVPSLAGTGAKVVTYTFTNGTGCSASQSATIVVNECADRHITLDKITSVIVYPVPNDGHFSLRIKTDLYTRLGIKVYSADGKLVKNKLFTGIYYDRELPVDLSALQAGVYSLYLYNDENGFIKRVVNIIISK